MEGPECNKTLSEEVNGELEALEAIYPGEGEFSIVRGPNLDEDLRSNYVCQVTIRPADIMLGLSFALPASYPEICPRIELVAVPDSLPQTSVAELLVHLYQVAKQSMGMPLLFGLVEAAKDWLQNLQEEVQVTQPEASTTSNPVCEAASEDRPKKNEKKSGRAKQSADDGEKSGRQTKKPPMKTASDVISRIQWDKQLNPEHFVVGYLDRFIGVVEQPFSMFSWEDIASVDYHTLAIPRHRIQYFKYKDEVVWDKTKRLDNVFGSLGSSITIVDVVERFAKENSSEEEGDEKDTDDMFDFEIQNDYDGDDSTMRTDKNDANIHRRHPKKRVNKSRPNYFIAMHITDEDIISKVKDVQKHMSGMDPLLSSYLMSPAHLHITLCTLQLATEAQVSTALSVLKSIQHELASMLLPITMLRFEGLAAFHERIIYSPPQADAALEKMTRFLRKSLQSAGLSLAGTREEFVPHLTILKMPREEASGHPVFSSDLNREFLDCYFGMQAVDAIHLCSMVDKPPPDRFYHSIARVDLMG
ncbi:leukocyte receptor cluster member 9-like [Diadema setosum]|uniref:leukocyte receptor cluster member 9-like n=1 Tax=Diadema setosum TaxID=31175 RepID=UPI003B3BE177